MVDARKRCLGSGIRVKRRPGMRGIEDPRDGLLSLYSDGIPLTEVAPGGS